MPTNLMEQFLKDAQNVPVNNEELDSIAKLATEQLHCERVVRDLESALEAAKEALKHVQEFLLPEAMATVGMSEFKLLDGSKISIKDDIYASIRTEKICDAVNWLDDNGLGDVVKDDVTVKFGRGDAEQAKILMAFCRNHKFNAGEKLSVHPQTLKALVKEQLQRGVQFPEEFFSIAPVRKSVIKTK